MNSRQPGDAEVATRYSVEHTERMSSATLGCQTRGVRGFNFDSNTQSDETNSLLLLMSRPSSCFGVRPSSKAGML